jgi:hypothetical protein
MTVLVVMQTFVLLLLAMLVAGLLRSHAEILRRLAETDRARGGEGPELPPAREAATPAVDVVGTTPEGATIKVGVTGMQENTLLAFLSTGCSSCLPLWAGLTSTKPPVLPPKTRLVVLTKDRSHESISKLLEIAPRDIPVMMSSAAWEDYRIQGSPYFIYVDGPSGRIHSEGAATNWGQVLSLLGDALLETELGRNGDGSAERIRRADAELASAGIHPGHPSLYGDGSPLPEEQGHGHH